MCTHEAHLRVHGLASQVVGTALQLTVSTRCHKLILSDVCKLICRRKVFMRKLGDECRHRLRKLCIALAEVLEVELDTLSYQASGIGNEFYILNIHLAHNQRLNGLQAAAHVGIEDGDNNLAVGFKGCIFEALKDLIHTKGIYLMKLKSKYPQGAEKQLIYAITGREVPSGGLPAAVGCAVFNAATCMAIHDAVYEGMPLIRRIVTVSGDIVMEPKNLMVPIGTAYNDLLEAVGHSENPYKVLSGGPMMGAAQYDLSVPTIKGTNAVTILGRGNRFVVEESACIRCGKCIDACPMKLMPVLMYKSLQSGNIEEMKAQNLMDCIECGCCAYTCPASVPLVLGFRVAKQVIRNDMAKQAAKK